MPNVPPPHGTVPQCYKVISKCVFTCQKCPFSTTKLYHLNEHVKSEHLQLDDSAHVCTFCSYITDKKTNLKVKQKKNMSIICVFSIRRMIDFTLGFITYKRFQFSIV